MGWANGSELADDVWDLVLLGISETLDKSNYDIPDEELASYALCLVRIFEKYDCDTMYECEFVEEFLEWDEDKEDWKIKGVTK